MRALWTQVDNKKTQHPFDFILVLDTFTFSLLPILYP